MLSKCMASSLFAIILHVTRLRQAVHMNTSVTNFAPQLSCQGSKLPHDYPLQSPPTVLSVSNEANFSLCHGEIGKIEVLGKAAPCKSFL